MTKNWSPVFRLGFRLGFWWTVFALELTALLLIQLPAVYNFQTFVLYDPGSVLRADSLIAQGLSPTIDFGYSYGMLSLLYGRLIFALGGRTPAMYLVGTWLMEMLMALGLARFAVRWGWASRALLVVAAPHAVHPIYLALTHPMEAALLIHAVADLADGRRARALALTSACVFIKPSMAFALGLALLIPLAWRLWRERASNERLFKDIIAAFAPAALTVAFCVALIAGYFGWRPLLNSIMPLTASRSYAALGFGFFGNGRKFWWPELNGAGDFIRYYLTTPAGFWVAASLSLCALCAAAIIGFKAEGAKANDRETLIAVTACHLFFIVALFAWPGSWAYYSYLLVLGVGAGISLFRSGVTLRFHWACAMLILLALTGHEQRYRWVSGDWRHSERAAETAMLWADEKQRAEWARALEMARRKRLLFLHNGCAGQLFPLVQSPPSWFFSPGIQTPNEIAAIRRQIETSDVVVSFNHAAILDPWTWEEFADLRAQFTATWRGVYFTIHERDR
ncbi:MAG TPA: hypothetical protein VJ810_43010 [Blastocatellia bacterium]|nr:hypothetical protein [Blastocatellia bacterium]